jgi:hypothetical protein
MVAIGWGGATRSPDLTITIVASFGKYFARNMMVFVLV